MPAAANLGSGIESLADPAVALVVTNWAGACDTAGLALWACADAVVALGSRYQAARAKKRQRIPVMMRDDEERKRASETYPIAMVETGIESR